MIEEHAIVVGIENNNAMLEIFRRKPCGLCGQTRGCGISLWGRLFGHHSSVFKAANQINAKIGDTVVVGIEEQALLLSSLAVYGIPLVMLLLGVLLAGVVAPSALHADRNALLGAVVGLVLGFLWLKGHTNGRSMDARYQPVILRVDDGSVIEIKCKRGE